MKLIWTEKKIYKREIKCWWLSRFISKENLMKKNKDEIILVDFKTSKAVYSDMIIQLSCYAELIKENDGIEIDRAVIVRFPKDDDETEIKGGNFLKMILLLV